MTDDILLLTHHPKSPVDERSYAGKIFFGKMHENGLPDRIPYRELLWEKYEYQENHSDE